MAAMDTSQAFAAASSAMVRGVDAASTLHMLMADCVRLLDATTAGILVQLDDTGLELLAAYSHEATELEMHQTNIDSGPCVDAVKLGHRIEAAGADLTQRWPVFGAAMRATGFHSVYAIPMTWRGHVLGGLNVFWTSDSPRSESDTQLLGAFADICTLALMQAVPSGDEAAELRTHLQSALRGRVAIERAKGILAHNEELDMAAAFHRLIEISEQSGQPLATVAHQLVASSYLVSGGEKTS